METHLKAIRARHFEIDARIDREQRRPTPDLLLLKVLKQLRLRLKDRIREIETQQPPRVA